MIRARRPSDRRWLLATPLIILAAVLSAGMLRAALDQRSAAPPPTATAAPSASSDSSGGRSSGQAAAAPEKPVTDPLRLAGPVPPHGTGQFSYAPGRGRVLGSAGPVRRFRVAVERGSGEDLASFSNDVEIILGDARSWIGNRRVRLQRVAGNDANDFTVYLATRESAAAMCARGGIDISAGDKPYTSCRATGGVIINLDRWRLSAGPYISANIPLEVYRQYVINHEVGHELGEGHQGCPRRGGPAPVMVQQTLSLRGCVPYAWPRRGNRPLSGPDV